MNLDFFKSTRILDGGMGQEILARGVKPHGTLWSASALINEKYHQTVIDIHKDFIDAGAESIVTTSFTTRQIRLRENNLEDQFDQLNSLAGSLACKARDLSKKQVLIAGGLPPQNNTYLADDRSEDEIKSNFYNQAKILNSYIDYFYLDVLSSVREFKLGIDVINEFKKPYLIGIHITEGTKLPSGETINDVIDKINKENLLGVILGCVSPENYLLNIKELKKFNLPFGFKINGFKNTRGDYQEIYRKNAGNPNEFLGKRDDLTEEKIFNFAKEVVDNGGTILGGCCEISPKQIKIISRLK